MARYELIAEFPSDEFGTSLQAIEATAQCILGGKHTGQPILLSAQSYENDGEHFVMFDGRYLRGAFQFECAVPEVESLVQALGIPAERVVVSQGAHSIRIEGASALELTCFLDRVYRECFKIKLLPGEESYNFVAEVEVEP